MLYAIWPEAPQRMTRDLDLLSSGNHEAESLSEVFREIFQQEVDEDGLIFDADAMDVAAIRDDQMYGGIRLRTTARLDNAVIPVRIDIGFGDAVTPDSVEVNIRFFSISRLPESTLIRVKPSSPRNLKPW